MWCERSKIYLAERGEAILFSRWTNFCAGCILQILQIYTFSTKTISMKLKYHKILKKLICAKKNVCKMKMVGKNVINMIRVFPTGGNQKMCSFFSTWKNPPPLPKTAIIKTLHKVRMLQYLIAKQAFLNISISHQL